MLPQFDNTGIRMGSGLPHGDFAWFLRGHPGVRSVWGELYPEAVHGAFLRGTLGSPALTPPRTEGKAVNYAKKKGKGVSGEWLHVDYSPPRSSGRNMYQSTLYLRPDLCVGTAGGSSSGGSCSSSSSSSSSSSGGNSGGSNGGSSGAGAWGRIGLMVTMAPPHSDPAADRRVEAILLAAAIRGDGAKATAGLEFGLLQPLSPYPPKKPAGSVQRLQPRLRDGVGDDQQVAVSGGGVSGGAGPKKGKQVTVGKLRAMAPTSKTPGNGMVDVCSLRQLRRLVHPRAEALLANHGLKDEGRGDEEEEEGGGEEGEEGGAFSATPPPIKKRRKTTTTKR